MMTLIVFIYRTALFPMGNLVIIGIDVGYIVVCCTNPLVFSLCIIQGFDLHLFFSLWVFSFQLWSPSVILYSRFLSFLIRMEVLFLMMMMYDRPLFVSGSQVEKAHNADLHCVDWNPHDQNLILTGYF